MYMNTYALFPLISYTVICTAYPLCILRCGQCCNKQMNIGYPFVHELYLLKNVHMHFVIHGSWVQLLLLCRTAANWSGLPTTSLSPPMLPFKCSTTTQMVSCHLACFTIWPAKNPIQQNLYRKDTPNKGYLSNENTVYCPNHRAVYKSTSELRAPLYTG